MSASQTDQRQTLTDYCRTDPAAFDEYLEQKDAFLQKLDEAALSRINAALEAKLAWVA